MDRTNWKIAQFTDFIVVNYAFIRFAHRGVCAESSLNRLIEFFLLLAFMDEPYEYPSTYCSLHNATAVAVVAAFDRFQLNNHHRPLQMNWNKRKEKFNCKLCLCRCRHVGRCIYLMWPVIRRLSMKVELNQSFRPFKNVGNFPQRFGDTFKVVHFLNKYFYFLY